MRDGRARAVGDSLLLEQQRINRLLSVQQIGRYACTSVQAAPEGAGALAGGGCAPVGVVLVRGLL